MAVVVLQGDLARRYTAGRMELEVEARDYRQLLAELERRYPGIGVALSGRVAVAIDGEIHADPLLQAIGPQSEVHFLPVIAGG